MKDAWIKKNSNKIVGLNTSIKKHLISVGFSFDLKVFSENLISRAIKLYFMVRNTNSGIKLEEEQVGKWRGYGERSDILIWMSFYSNSFFYFTRF